MLATPKTLKPQNCHLHNVRVEVKAVLETLGQVLKVPVVADLGHGNDALDTDAVRIDRVDDHIQISAVPTLNLKLNNKPISVYHLISLLYVRILVGIEQKANSL